MDQRFRSARCAAAAGALVITGLAAPAAGSGPTRLAGTTVVTATRSAWTSVVLPRAVTLSNQDVWGDRVVAVSGRGRIIGVELAGTGQAKGSSLSAYRYNFCYRAGCAGGRESQLLTSAYAPHPVKYGPSNGEEPTRLPAGVYRLLVVTDGAPITATLRLRGLTGRARVRPSAPVQASARTLTFTTPTPPTPVSTRFSGGTTFTLDGHQGGVRTMFEVRRETAVEDMTGFCVYDGDPPPAYLRGCPGGGGLGIGYIGLTRTPTRTRSWGSYGSLGEGTYAAGEYYDVTGSAADPHGVIAVVTYPSGWDL